MRRSDPIVRVTRAAIGRAKRRGDDEVTPDDLLLAALREVSRFGVALVGPWTFDLETLAESERTCADEDRPSGSGGEVRPEDSGGSGRAEAAPRYANASVAVFEAAVRAAREDGAPTLGVVHLLVALGEREEGLMARLQQRHGFTPTEWRAALARGSLGPSEAQGEALAGADGRAGGTGGLSGDGRGTAPPELLSVDQAASFLGVHAQTVRNYIRAGKLPAYRLAGERFIRVLRRDLLALLEPVAAEDAQEEEAPEVELPVNPSL